MQSPILVFESINKRLFCLNPYLGYHQLNAILILSASLSCTDINSLVNEITTNNMMESEYIGFAGIKSEEYQRFQKFKSIASNEELRSFIENENQIIRTYGYLTMIERNLIKPSEAFENALRKNQTFSKMSADQKSSSDICTKIYFDNINNNSNAKFSIKSDNFSSVNSEIRKMDSLILYKLKDNHFLQYMALKDKTHDLTYNARIMELALEFSYPSAIFYLNNIQVDKSQLRESIRRAIDKKRLGSEPKRKLNKILKDLN